jgi:hypothetical protein
MCVVVDLVCVNQTAALMMVVVVMVMCIIAAIIGEPIDFYPTQAYTQSRSCYPHRCTTSLWNAGTIRESS